MTAAAMQIGECAYTQRRCFRVLHQEAVFFCFLGRGEAIRYILHYAKVNFEDTFITLDEWPQKQSSEWRRL